MLQVIKNIFLEMKSFYIFYLKLEKNKRDIVFYAEDRAEYGYYEGLINYLTTIKNSNICYISSDIADPILSKELPNVKALYIKTLLAFFTVMLDSRLIIMTMPDLHRFHIRRSQRGTHHIYLFHNIGSSFPVIRFGALFYYDTIFCVGEHHIEEIRRQEELYNLPKKNLVKFGYFRLEKIYHDYNSYILTNKSNPSLYRARILVGPSWGQCSILDVCGSRLIRLLLEKNYEVIVRPHPMTRLKNPHLLEALNREFKDFKNYRFEGGISSIESVYKSDLLISDWSGLVFEYAFGTERPVLFIDLPQKIVNPKYKEIDLTPIDVKIRTRIGALIGLGDLDKIDLRISELLNHKDIYINEIRKARREFIYNFNESSRVGAEFIAGFLGNNKLSTLTDKDEEKVAKAA